MKEKLEAQAVEEYRDALLTSHPEKEAAYRIKEEKKAEEIKKWQDKFSAWERQDESEQSSEPPAEPTPLEPRTFGDEIKLEDIIERVKNANVEAFVGNDVLGRHAQTVLSLFPHASRDVLWHAVCLDAKVDPKDWSGSFGDSNAAFMNTSTTGGPGDAADVGTSSYLESRLSEATRLRDRLNTLIPDDVKRGLYTNLKIENSVKDAKQATLIDAIYMQTSDILERA